MVYSQVGINTTNPQGIFNVDGAKDNPLTGVPNASQQLNDFTVTATGRMGIGNTSPTEKLDVTGKIKLSQLGNYNGNTAVPLVWDSSNQTISMGASDTEKPFSTIKYVIRTADSQDWVRNFNTRISTDKYIVIITSAQFEKLSGSSFIRTSAVYPSQTGDTSGSTISLTPFFNFGAYQGSGTWRLKADYKDAAPPLNSGNDYQWTFDLLVINKNQVINIAPQTGSVGATGDGEASASPLP